MPCSCQLNDGDRRRFFKRLTGSRRNRDTLLDIGEAIRKDRVLGKAAMPAFTLAPAPAATLRRRLRSLMSLIGKLI
jgi:hypothetical protein